MTVAQRRIAVTVTVAVFAASLLVVLLGGCSGRSNDDDGCGWFALAAVAKPTAPPPKAPSLEKKPIAPAATVRPDGVVQAPQGSSVRKPSPAASKTKAKKHGRHDSDICDDD